MVLKGLFIGINARAGILRINLVGGDGLLAIEGDERHVADGRARGQVGFGVDQGNSRDLCHDRCRPRAGRKPTETGGGRLVAGLMERKTTRSSPEAMLSPASTWTSNGSPQQVMSTVVS